MKSAMPHQEFFDEVERKLLIYSYISVLGTKDALKALREMFPREEMTAIRHAAKRNKRTCLL